MVSIAFLVFDQLPFVFRLLPIVKLSRVVFVCAALGLVVVLRAWITKDVLILGFGRGNRVIRINASKSDGIYHHPAVDIDLDKLLIFLR